MIDIRLARFALAAGVALLAACDNRPTSTDVALSVAGYFEAYHVVDERTAPTVVLDTAVAEFWGSSQASDLGVTVNGTAMDRMYNSITGDIVHVAAIPVVPGEALEVEVVGVGSGAEATNLVTPPAIQPTLTSPLSDSVYDRNTPIPISWSGSDSGAVYLRASVGSETAWGADLAGSAGTATMPDSIWAGVDDSVAVLDLWHVVTVDGVGFQGPVSFAAGFLVTRLVRVTPAAPGTAPKSGRFGSLKLTRVGMFGRKEKGER